MGREMARLAERKAAAEGEYDQMAAKLWDEYQLTLSQAEELCVEFENVNVLRAQVADLRGRIRALATSMSAPSRSIRRSRPATTPPRSGGGRRGQQERADQDDHQPVGQMKDIFTDSFRAINENFGRVFTELFGGGEASLVLEDESDVLSCGIGIRWPRRARSSRTWKPCPAASRRWWPSASIFAILAVNPAPSASSTRSSRAG